MNKRYLAVRAALAGASLLSLTAVAAAQTAAGDPVAGEKTFMTCGICHKVGPGAMNSIGPVLNGVVNRPAGTYPGYAYTDANKNSGVVWDEKTLAAYLPDPQKLIPGTKMPFMLPDPQDVANVIAYLKQFDAQGNKK